MDQHSKSVTNALPNKDDDETRSTTSYCPIFHHHNFFLTLFPSVHFIDMSEISVFSIEVPLLVGGEAVFLDSTSGWKNELKEERRSSMCIQLLSHFCYKLYGECKINCAMVLITSSFQS